LSDAPERIWLQLYGDASPDDGPVDYRNNEVTWCWENIFEHDIEYIRADIHSAEVERLREALRRAADEPNIDKARAIADEALK
jgi:predicted esterase